MAGQKNRRKRKPETLVYGTERRKSPYRSSATARINFKIWRSSTGHRFAEDAMLSQKPVVRVVSCAKFFVRSSPLAKRDGSTSQSGFTVLISQILSNRTSSRYSLPT